MSKDIKPAPNETVRSRYWIGNIGDRFIPALDALVLGYSVASLFHGPFWDYCSKLYSSDLLDAEPKSASTGLYISHPQVREGGSNNLNNRMLL